MPEVIVKDKVPGVGFEPTIFLEWLANVGNVKSHEEVYYACNLDFGSC